jgi:hypothetical protein
MGRPPLDLVGSSFCACLPNAGGVYLKKGNCLVHRTSAPERWVTSEAGASEAESEQRWEEAAYL